MQFRFVSRFEDDPSNTIHEVKHHAHQKAAIAAARRLVKGSISAQFTVDVYYSRGDYDVRMEDRLIATIAKDDLGLPTYITKGPAYV